MYTAPPIRLVAVAVDKPPDAAIETKTSAICAARLHVATERPR